MEAMGGFALVVLLFRLTFFVIATVVKVLAILLFSPLIIARGTFRAFTPRPPQYRKRHNSRSRSSRRDEYDDEETFAYNFGQLVKAIKYKPGEVTAAPAKLAAAVANEPSRNQQDTVVALKQLGIPRHLAEKTALEVVQQLGANAPLNDMVKLALQRVGTAK